MMKLSFIFSLLCSFPMLAAVNVPLDPDTEPPALLSETGVLTADGLEYSVIQPLWVDFAAKSRRLILPEGKRVQVSKTDAYKFPVGTVFVKHFQMEVSKNVFRNIETRILVRKSGEDREKWVGYTYQWDGNDAKLVTGKLSPEVILEVDASAEGGARTQKFKIPSRSQCLKCHNESVGFVRSFVTRQLNHSDQLELFSKKGIFSQRLGPAAQYEKLALITDESAELDQRARSYLDVNCAHCHNPTGTCNSVDLDFRFGILNAEALVSSGHLVKGSKEGSQIFQRMSSVKPGQRMPFIGSSLRDEAALDTIGSWIDSLH